MDDLLSFLVKEIVEKPKEVEVLLDESQNSNDVTLIIDSNPEDVPLIIGRKGRTIKALRNIVGILALKENKRAHITVKHQKDRNTEEFEGVEESDTIIEERPKISKRTSKSKVSTKKNKPKEDTSETEDILGF